MTLTLQHAKLCTKHKMKTVELELVCSKPQNLASQKRKQIILPFANEKLAKHGIPKQHDTQVPKKSFPHKVAL